MTDLRDRLRRASELVSPVEPAYERLLRKRERNARNRRFASASFALVLAAAVLVGVFAGLGRLRSPSLSGDGPGAAAGDLPEALKLAPGEYFYEKTSRILPDAPGSNGGTVVVETWWSLDGSGRKEAELTTASYSPGPTGTWGPGDFPLLETDLSGLSTDPEELAVQLRERSDPGGASPQPPVTPGPGQSSESGGLWRAVSDLLEMPNAVPELRAALVRVAAGIPGVRVLEDSVDPAGRSAVALAFRSEGADRELFFDAETLQFMAEVEDYGAEGTWYLIVDSAGIVDSTDERPVRQQLFFEPRITGPQSPPVPESPPIPTFAPSPPIRPGADWEVTFSPPRGVRGAELRVTVEGLDDHSGAQVDLTFATKDGTDVQGVGSGEDRVDDNGRLETTITVPGVIAHEYQVVPGEYRLVFLVKPERLLFEETLQVIAAAVGEKYPYTFYECLEYAFFDGRLWERESGDVTTPVAGTIELVASDRAVYMTANGKTVVFRVANPAAIDPETYRCPPT